MGMEGDESPSLALAVIQTDRGRTRKFSSRASTRTLEKLEKDLEKAEEKERDASQAAAVAERTLHETGRTLLLEREQECFRRLLQSLRGMLEGLQDILRT